MKQLTVTYSNGENDLWYIPEKETLKQALKGIEKEMKLNVVNYELVKGW